MIHLLLAIIYMAFVSLGLPDPLLGAAWPMMYGEMGVPLSYAGLLSMIIAAGTIISSLLSDKLTKKLSTGLVTAISVGMTAVALLGFSLSHQFWLLCLFAIPYGLGAGSVDAALNNYVALHYSSKHMSWLHCMWGVGTIIGPYILSFALMQGKGWNGGYGYVSILQIVLSAVLFISLPIWKKTETKKTTVQPQEEAKTLTLLETLCIPGAKEVMFAFFCYCGAEATAILWASSYMVLHNGISEELAAICASIFFIGITVGRLIGGFLTAKLDDTQMTRLGEGILLLGILILFLPFGQVSSIVGVILVGLGCAPIYPCIIHATPARFGSDKSQALIGVQMASAYVGTCLMPPIFGLIANHITVALFPVYLLIISVLMIFMNEQVVKKTKVKHIL